MRNYGQHNATLCGVREARFEITVTMDDDLQHPPEEIPILLAELEKGYDVVYRAPRKLPQGFIRNLLTHATKVLLARVHGGALSTQHFRLPRFADSTATGIY